MLFSLALNAQLEIAIVGLSAFDRIGSFLPHALEGASGRAYYVKYVTLRIRRNSCDFKLEFADLC